MSTRPYFKLFVGCISYDAVEEDLLPVFSSFGEVVEFTIQRDRDGRSRGCAWLKYTTREACEDCITNLSGNYYVNGMRSAIVVKYAVADEEGSMSPLRGGPARLFVGGFPAGASEEDIKQLLRNYGKVVEFTRLTKSGVPSGPFFVTLADKLSSQALLRLNGRVVNFFNSSSGSYELVTLRVSAAFSPVRGPQIVPPTLILSSSSQASSSSVGGYSPLNHRSPGKLFVGCLPYSRTSADISDLFGQYGDLLEVALLTGPDGKSKGAAFVTFSDRENAERAVEELQGHKFPNSSRGINISFATRQSRPTRLSGQTPVTVASPSERLRSIAADRKESGTTASAPSGVGTITEKESSSIALASSARSEEILRYLQFGESLPGHSSAAPNAAWAEPEDLTQADFTSSALLHCLFGENDFPPL